MRGVICSAAALKSKFDMFLSRFADIFPSRLAVVDEDLSSAKALHEQMQTEGVPANELSLKRLAALYRNHGETAPFPEPPVSHARIHTHTSGSW